MKNDFKTVDLIIIGATIILAGLAILGLGFDYVSIGANGILFNF